MRVQKKQLGYSLIELSIVITIASLLAVGGLSIATNKAVESNLVDTKDRIVTIKKALKRYYAANSKLPCPAQGSKKLGDVSSGSGGDADYGVQIFAGLCDAVINTSNNTSPTSTLRVLGSDGSTYVRIGTVPTRTLGLPDSMMYDAYGSKFTYMVTEPMTSTFDKTSAGGKISVDDGISPTPHIIATNSAIAIISHGKDAKGAYTSAGGASAGIACATAGTSRDAENCDGDATITDTQFNDFSSANTAWYDDYVMWATRDELIDLTNTFSGTAGCGYAFFVDSGTFVRPSGVTTFRVLAIGGGGGGGGAGSNYGGGGGGGGKIDVATVTTSGDPVVTIGSGGNGGNDSTTGSDGGTTSLTNTSPAISAAGGSGGLRGNVGEGTGGNGGIAGRGGVWSSNSSVASDGTDQSGIAVKSGGEIISDGTDTITFTCAKFRIVSPNYDSSVVNTGLAYTGGTGGSGVYSDLAPISGAKLGGAFGASGANYGISGTGGGGGGGSSRTTSASPTSGGKGGGGGDGGTVSSAQANTGGGGGGGYGGGGGGGSSGSSTTYCGGGGGGYGGGAGGGYAGYGGGGGGGGPSGGGSGCTLGGYGGTGYGGGGGGGGGSSYAGGGGGGNGLVYIEWDK